MRSLLVFLLSFALMFSMVTISSATDVSSEMPEDVTVNVEDENSEDFFTSFFIGMDESASEAMSTWALNRDMKAYGGDLCEGLFFLKSRASTDYVNYYLTDLDYYSVTAGSFTDSENQQWRLINAGNGYYKITSFQTDHCLTAVAGGQEGMLSLENYSDAKSDRQLWKFIATTTNSSVGNTYRIVPKAYENTMCLGISETAGIYGHEGLQKEYNTQTNFFNEWYLVTYQTDISIFYDMAYDAKFDNVGESAEESLLELVDSVNRVYIKTLGLKFNVYEMEMIESTPDKCKIANNQPLTANFRCPANPSINENCEYYNYNKSINGDCENCTSRLQLYRDFICDYSGAEDNASILVSGHRLYDDNGITCNRSFKWYDYGISLQLYHSPSNYNIEAFSVLVHEIAHHIGAKDHYHEIRYDDKNKPYCVGGEFCFTCNPRTARPTWCIMVNGNLTPSQLENAGYDEIFCSGCLYDMRFYLRNNILN